jgi:hypothetical protein
MITSQSTQNIHQTGLEHCVMFAIPTNSLLWEV